mgnify:CR=1 FL=1
MAVTARGEIEWDGLLISPSRPSVDGLWLSSTARLDGWEPEFSYEDMATAVGAAPGRAVAMPMRPAIVGLCVTDADDLAVLEASKGAGTLEWWDEARDVVAAVECDLRIVEPSHDRADVLAPHVVTYVEWFVARPGDIDWGGGS